MTNENGYASPEQEAAIKHHIKQASEVVEWIESMPALDKFGQSLVLGLLAGRSEGVDADERGVAEEEIDKIVKWSTDRLIELLVLSGVVRAHIAMRWDDETDQPKFKLTEQGRRGGVEIPTSPYDED